ncbi:MAG: hypothetical protein RL591_10 [Planctomycetota bacterium]
MQHFHCLSATRGRMRAVACSFTALALLSPALATASDGSYEDPYIGVQNPSFDLAASSASAAWRMERWVSTCEDPIEVVQEANGEHRAYARLLPQYQSCANSTSCDGQDSPYPSILSQKYIKVRDCPNIALQFDFRVDLLDEVKCIPCTDYEIFSVTVFEHGGDLLPSSEPFVHTFSFNLSDLEAGQFSENEWARVDLPFQRARADSLLEVRFQLTLNSRQGSGSLGGRGLFPAILDIDHVELVPFVGAVTSPCIGSNPLPCVPSGNPNFDVRETGLTSSAGLADLASPIVCALDDGRLSCCVNDLNFDGMVNGADLGVLLGAWGRISSTSASQQSPDLNGDGVVNGADLGILLGSWGECPD